MADPLNPAPRDPAAEPTEPPANPAPPADRADRLGRYDANLQLIRRRLADHNRTNKPRWWWPVR